MEVNVDLSDIDKQLDDIATNKKLGQFLASEAEKGMEPYVPFRDGALVGSAKTEPFKVTYDTPYADYVYEGKNMTIKKEKHPLATKEWDKAYAEAHLDELGRAGTRYVRTML